MMLMKSNVQQHHQKQMMTTDDAKANSFLWQLYGDCNMSKLQDFAREHKRYREDRFTKSNLIRYTMITVNISLVFLTLTMYGPYNFFKYLTNWTCLLGAYSIFLSAEAATNLNFNSDVYLQRKHHFFYSFSFLLNVVVTCVFWTLLNPNTIVVYKDQLPILLEQWAVHSLPMITCLGNTYLTNCVLSIELLRPLVMVSFLYLAINFAQTKVLGEPVYKFMKWDDINSSCILVTSLIWSFCLIYIAFCKMDEYVKQESLLMKKVKVVQKKFRKKNKKN